MLKFLNPTTWSLNACISLFFMSLGCMSVSAGASPERFPEDLLRDKLSKPDQVLDFFGVQPGWQVMDMFAGNGYYSEVLSGVVGPSGKVYLHNNQAYMQFATRLQSRVRNNRLPNVEVYIREIEDINLPSNSLDMVLLVMAYHDAYFTQNGWTVTAGPLFKTIHRILKPDGILAIIDHHAADDTGYSRAQDLHRIEVSFAKSDVSHRGFQWIGSSDVLENESDDLTLSVFDPMIRGNTSRFVLKFKKDPEHVQ